MKKVLAVLLVLVIAVTCICLAACKDTNSDQGKKEASVPFEVGTDVASYTDANASAYASSVCANVKIVAGEDVLFSGKVTVKSDTLYAHEFFNAACEEKSLSQSGLEMGFVTEIGQYAMNTETNTYWMWYYNGHNPTSFAVNDVHVFDGDYLLFSYEEVQW